jgi:hypothetical protein
LVKDPSNDWNPFKCDLNDLTTDQTILSETQLILVKILLAMEFQMCEGIILALDCKCRDCTSRKMKKEQKKKKMVKACLDATNKTKMYSSSRIHDDDDCHVSPFVALELLARLKYDGGGDDERMGDEFPVIRISYAYAPTEKKALLFLRDIDKDRVQKIRVRGAGQHHHVVGYESDIGSETDCSLVWKELTLDAICPFVLPTLGGLLDPPSGLRVHEGVLLPLRDDKNVGGDSRNIQDHDKMMKDHESLSYFSSYSNVYDEDNYPCCFTDSNSNHHHHHSDDANHIEKSGLLMSNMQWFFSLPKSLILHCVAIGTIFVVVIFLSMDARSSFFDERFHIVNFPRSTILQLLASVPNQFRAMIVWARYDTITTLSSVKHFLQRYRFGGGY